MKLSNLIDRYDRTADPEICGITADSRKVAEGYLFVALPGLMFNGADFIQDAIKSGAVAILCVPEAKLDNDDVVWITDECPGRVFPHIVANYYVKQPNHIAAVTGTNGKTSVAFFTQQIWKHMGLKSASVGTLGIVSDDYNQYTGLTTPDPVVIHKALNDLCENGVDHVVFEASSHGLDQHRIDGVRISSAAFTNLTHDHLDYHETTDDYFNAKKRLFTEVLKPSGTAVLNLDNPFVADVQKVCEAKGHQIITVGHNQGDIRLLNQRSSASGQDITVSYQSKIYDVSLPLVGSFQAMNALMAVGLVIGCGGDADLALNSLSYLKPVRGRMEQAGRHNNGARIYVDYAHTPDALETALTAIRPHVSGKLSVVFGCGGDRDRTKRKVMGQIANDHADRIYVTDDNPRSEDPNDIRNEIMTGCPDAIDGGDRYNAIHAAVSDLQKGDILLVAGKGHEQGQTIGDKVIDFDDVSAVRKALLEIEEYNNKSKAI